jgi:hypothetical protein
MVYNTRYMLIALIVLYVFLLGQSFVVRNSRSTHITKMLFQLTGERDGIAGGLEMNNTKYSDRKEDDDINALVGGESFMDQHIEETVAKMLVSDRNIKSEKTPEEKWSDIYQTLKSSGIKSSSKKAEAVTVNSTTTARRMTAEQMLAILFPVEKLSTPFNEAKVMVKLRQDMNVKDFEDTFKDPNIGDIY